MGFDLASAQPVEAPKGNFDLASAQPSQAAPQAAAPDQPTSLSDIGKNFLSAAMRPVMNAASAVPELAANTGVALRNISEQAVNRMAPNFAHAIYAANQHLAGDSQMLQALLPQGPPAGNYDSFSSMYRPAIDETYRAPEGFGKGAEFVSSALAGGGVPAPQAASQAPAAFVRAVTTPKQLTLGASQQAGYVVPPATTNPTIPNIFMESLGGKAATAADASLANQTVTNSLAKKSVGLADDVSISKDALAAIRSAAAPAYETLRNVGAVKLDETAIKGLDSIASKYTGSDLAKAIGGANDIPKIVQAVKDESLTGAKAVDAISLLRDKANAAYASGDKALGKAYRSVSQEVENLMERNLSGDALKAFRDARTLMAKTYTVESALNSSTGNIVASKLASQLDRNKPLSDELLTAAKFAKAFPKAAKEVGDSGAVRNTDVVLGGLAAVMKQQPWYLAYPFARLGARAGLLSPAGQKLAVPNLGGGVPPGLLMGAAPAEDLLGQ